MRLTSYVLLALAATVPLSAAVSSEVTIPVAGYLVLSDDLTYRTEAVITNHSDRAKTVVLELVHDGHAELFRVFTIDAHETMFLPTAGLPSASPGLNGTIGALRLRTDGTGGIEAKAVIVAERRISRGSSRQEVEGVPMEEYHANETYFLGVRHSAGTGAYTNVGITNLSETETVTFFVQFQFHTQPTAVTVPPLSMRQIRVTGPGNAGRWVRVWPEWSDPDGTPAHSTPWVAYASTVDTHTGDAYSGQRVPAHSKFRP
ncbi:MAG TPA: hypothetical protein VF266_23640 [Thermoanaerobaculia bacterium]